MPSFNEILWQIYRREPRPRPTAEQIDQLWLHPALRERILDEHLDDSDGVASRPTAEQQQQVAWLWEALHLSANAHLFDITCGPGLYATKFAQRGCRVTGLDFSPTVINYARDLAVSEGVADRCHFVEQDIRQMTFEAASFEAAILLYGQLESYRQAEAETLLRQIATTLKPGGRLCLEMLNQDRVDQDDSSWWYTDERGVWGDKPYFHLGERFWYAEEGLAIERYYLIRLETGAVDEVYICNQTYSVEGMTDLLRRCGFAEVDVYPAWGDLPLYDAEEWVVYIAQAKQPA